MLYKPPLVLLPTTICPPGHEFLLLVDLSPSNLQLSNRIIWFWIGLIQQAACHTSPLTLVCLLSVTMVMGIPTVKRKVKSYLSETLHSLIDKLSPEEKLDCVIIVFVGEVRTHVQVAEVKINAQDVCVRYVSCLVPAD